MAEISSGVYEEGQADMKETKGAKTHEFTRLTAVLHLDDRLVVLRRHLEWPVLHVALHFWVVDLATNEALRVEDGILGIGVECILRRITDQPFLVREADPRWCYPVTLVVGDNLHTAPSLHTYTRVAILSH